MEVKKLKFPKGFLWGAATSSHQVEGGTENQWSEWEKENAERLAEKAKTYWQDWQRDKFPEMLEAKNYISGKSCDHYNRYEEDFDIVKKLGHNAHRFSIEWSRIEPKEGEFNLEAVKHYQDVIKALRERGVEPFVALWHWTNPLWIQDKGGAESKEFSYYFSRYAQFMAKNLSDVKFWLTINEPTSVIAMSYARAQWPPQKKNIISTERVYRNLARAHNEGYESIHAVSNSAQVGFANLMQSFHAYHKRSILDNVGILIAKYFSNRRMIRLTKGYNDFMTVQYYFHTRFKFPKKIRRDDKPVNDLNWEIHPHGIYRILRYLKRYNLPIYVTENGLADAMDERRENFIKDHLHWIHRAISEGSDVRGYFYWSLLDNFEWDKGFWPRFGLVEIDYETLERKIRPSALEYARICKSNELEI
ncbi:glycoside hydrolase family 1 protein [Patescibacteria group bacterium]